MRLRNAAVALLGLALLTNPPIIIAQSLSPSPASSTDAQNKPAWSAWTTARPHLLHVAVQGHVPTYFQLMYNSSMAAGDLVSLVASRLGVHPDYIALFKDGPLVDRFKRVVNRRNSQRIGACSSWPNATVINIRTISELGVADGDTIQCYIRPLRGDHIHYAFAIYVHGELVDTFWDRPYIGAPFTSEGRRYPQTLSNLSANMNDYHLAQLYPHFGLHTGQAHWHGDGFSHVHPGTAWTWLRETEGLGATLDQWLENQGVAIWDAASTRYPIGSFRVPFDLDDNDLSAISITFPDKLPSGEDYMVGGEYDCSILQDGVFGRKGQNIGSKRHPLRDFESISHSPEDFTEQEIIINSNKTHTWRAYYWSFVDQEKPTVVEGGIGSIWLAENFGMIVLSYEERSKDPNNNVLKPPQCLMDAMKGSGWLQLLGFDGYPYPLPNAAGFNISGYSMPDKVRKLLNATADDRKVML